MLPSNALNKELLWLVASLWYETIYRMVTVTQEKIPSLHKDIGWQVMYNSYGCSHRMTTRWMSYHLNSHLLLECCRRAAACICKLIFLWYMYSINTHFHTTNVIYKQFFYYDQRLIKHNRTYILMEPLSLFSIL